MVTAIAGMFNEQLCPLAISLLDVMEESWVIPGTKMSKHLFKHDSFIQLFMTLTQHGLFSNLNKVMYCNL